MSAVRATPEHASSQLATTSVGQVACPFDDVRASRARGSSDRGVGGQGPSQAHPGGVWHARLAAMQVSPQAFPLRQIRQHVPFAAGSGSGASTLLAGGGLTGRGLVGGELAGGALAGGPAEGSPAGGGGRGRAGGAEISGAAGGSGAAGLGSPRQLIAERTNAAAKWSERAEGGPSSPRRGPRSAAIGDIVDFIAGCLPRRQRQRSCRNDARIRGARRRARRQRSRGVGEDFGTAGSPSSRAAARCGPGSSRSRCGSPASTAPARRAGSTGSPSRRG